MHSPCDPPKFVDQDFSKFDFSRWRLDGLTLDSAATAFAGLADSLFNSEEWQQHFKARLPELERQVLAAFKDQSRQLKEEQANTTQHFNERIAAAQEHSDNFRKAVEVSTAPPVIQASPDAFHLVVRVVSEEDQRLGLSDIMVQIIDPEDEKAILVKSFTDQNGNAILTVPPEIAGERDKQDTTLQALDSLGRPVANLPGAVCIRVGQTETQVVRVADSNGTAESKKAALELRSEREARARDLANRADGLMRELENILEGLECRLRNNEEIVAELERSEPTEKAAPPDQADSTQSESARKEPPPGGQKRRRKQ